MTDSLKVQIYINLEPLFFWILLVLGFSIVHWIEYMIFKNKLLNLIREQIPGLFEGVFTSKKGFFQFLAMNESTGNDSVDLLRLKTIRAYRFFMNPLFYVTILVLHIFLFYFLLVRT